MHVLKRSPRPSRTATNRWTMVTMFEEEYAFHGLLEYLGKAELFEN